MQLEEQISIYIHPEADQQAARTLEDIRKLGKKAGIAINPGTAVETIFELLPLVDYVMVMTVNPDLQDKNIWSTLILKLKN